VVINLLSNWLRPSNADNVVVLSMRYSHLFGKTSKEAPHDADSANARLLTQGGFINKLTAGVYTYLPLGLRVLKKVQDIVRQEMNKLGANEIYMPTLHPKELYDATERWDKIDVLFKLEGHGGKEYALGSTHEEVVTPLVKQYVHSYRDLPLSVYQIQDKFRNEARAKSGLLRGREFSMKDLYSFHLSEDDFWEFYEKSKQAYLNVFRRCGLKAIIVEASGGVFSKYSHEFQVATEHGEDTVFACDGKGCVFAQNKEIAELKEGDACKVCLEQGRDGTIRVIKTIEVGNIFPLKTRFTEAFDFKVQGPDNQMIDIIMGCYGIGPSRVMGSIVEVHHDERGMIWPKSVAPYHVHLVTLMGKDEEINERIEETATSLVDQLENADVEVLWDDREDTRAGEKFADADLIGVPLRLVISQKTLTEDSVEWKERHESESRIVKLTEATDQASEWLAAPDHLTSHE
jgi:prolyl-tRNA synthetase